MIKKELVIPELKKMSLKIGKPKHGWVPVKIKLNTYELIVNASNVGNDPIFELIDCAYFIRYGISGFRRVCFWLEPFTYILDFCKSSSTGDITTVIWSKGDEYPPVLAGKMKEEYRCFMYKEKIDIARIIINEINNWITKEPEFIDEYWSKKIKLYWKFTKQIKFRD